MRHPGPFILALALAAPAGARAEGPPTVPKGAARPAPKRSPAKSPALPSRSATPPLARYYVKVDPGSAPSLKIKPKLAAAAKAPLTVVVRRLDGKVVKKTSAAMLGGKAKSYPLPGIRPSRKKKLGCDQACFEVLVYGSAAAPPLLAPPLKVTQKSSQFEACVGPGVHFIDPAVLDGGRPGTSPPPDPEACK